MRVLFPDGLPRSIKFEVTLADGRVRIAEFIRAEKVRELMESDDLGPFLRSIVSQPELHRKDVPS